MLYALSWTGFDTRPLIATRAFEAMAAAETGVEAMGAAALLRFPSQNWVFATANGDIGWVLGAPAPAQASPLPLDGSVRSPARAARGGPLVLNPLRATSSAPTSPLGDREPRHALLGPYRALRATMALHEAETWSTADSRGLQMDTLNLEAVRVAPLLLAAVEGVSLSPLEQGMVDALAAWDHQMRKGLRGRWSTRPGGARRTGPWLRSGSPIPRWRGRGCCAGTPSRPWRRPCSPRPAGAGG
ncbi:MAG: penicillin acylase family protein [Alphaproteobacteria bacterium]|nr:penicillin acylase family protein [Alphaproteobacteria bacterium]